jgi:hypothetical protein
MVLKHVLTGILCSTLVLWSGLALADQYRPDEFLGMDLSKTALSPKPLGPPEVFVPVPGSAKSGRSSARAQTPREPKTTSSIAAPQPRVAERSAERGVEHRRGAGRVKLARHHSNPLDAEAFDTRIQVWPCKSGGICNWKR